MSPSPLVGPRMCPMWPTFSLGSRGGKSIISTLHLPSLRHCSQHYSCLSDFLSFLICSVQYVFRESVLDMMVCERTSTSFLANTNTFKTKQLSFDADTGEFLFEDFFLRAKQSKVIVATRPEVFFLVREGIFVTFGLFNLLLYLLLYSVQIYIHIQFQ